MTCNCNTGQRMWDVMPTVQAVEGDDLFTLSERGTLTVTPECATIFTPQLPDIFATRWRATPSGLPPCWRKSEHSIKYINKRVPLFMASR